MELSLRHAVARLACLAVLALPALAPQAASAASDPASNRSLSDTTEAACAQNPTGDLCIASALADINAAHAAEGVQPMVLPSNFASMSVPEQLLNLANLERVDRGMAPILGLSAALDQDAHNAAAQDEDPMPTHFYGTVATGNWAAGYDSTLEADFAWMYDDGLGSDNLDCTNSDRSGCWGHRHDILWNFGTPIAMGAGYATAAYGPSMTELFVGGDSRTGPGQPDAPVVRPSSAPAGSTSAASTSGNAGTGTVTGHAAGRAGGRNPRGWAGAVARSQGKLQVTVGCNGPAGRVCKLKVALGPPGHRATLVKTVRVSCGHRRTVVISLTQKARRLIRTSRRLRIHLVVDQSGRVLLSRLITMRRG